MGKYLYSADESIAYMAKKGIKFNLFSEDEAKKYIETSTYYKKISSYQKNFTTYIRDGEKVYADLEFAYLRELASLDVELRHIVLDISLDIEHSVKVAILNKCMELKFDGYDIVDGFFDKYPNVRENIEMNSVNSYCTELIRAHNSHFPIWVVVEVISFGDLCKLYKFMMDKGYFGDSKKSATKDVVGILYAVHNIRNAAAHNHCLLRDLRYSNDIQTEPTISRYVAQISSIKKDQRQKTLSTRFQHDFVCLIYAIDKLIISDGMKKDAITAIRGFIDRKSIIHKEYFKNCIPVKNAYDFCRKVVDFVVL